MIAKKCDELKISPETIPVAILFCRSRGIEIVEPIGEWIHLLKPIREVGEIAFSCPFCSSLRA